MIMQLCHFFCSFTFYFAVVNLFLQLYISLPDPILIDVRTTLKHKRTASLVTTPPPPVRRHHQIAAPGIVGTRNRPKKTITSDCVITCVLERN